MVWLALVADRQRWCLVLSLSTKLDRAEIAAAVGIPRGSVEVLLDSALRDLRPYADAAGGGRSVGAGILRPRSGAATEVDRPAGWYRHPQTPGDHAYWDGTTWWDWRTRCGARHTDRGA